jgi:hypothetical protein
MTAERRRCNIKAMPDLNATDRLLQRIRTLIRQTRADYAADDASMRGRRREIDRLKSELAECVKRNPTESFRRPSE